MMKRLRNESNGTYIYGALNCPGRPGWFITEHGIFKGAALNWWNPTPNSCSAFVKSGTFLPGFQTPGGWGQDWEDSGIELEVPCQVRTRHGDVYNASRWYCQPIRVGSRFAEAIGRLWKQACELHAAQRAAFAAKEAAELEQAREIAQRLRWAWDRKILSDATVREQLATAGRYASRIDNGYPLGTQCFQFGNWKLCEGGTAFSKGFVLGWNGQHTSNC